MSALDYAQLRSCLTHEDDAKRLVVTPLLDPKGQLNDRQASVDVRLGRVFSLTRAWTQGVAELLNEDGTGVVEPALEQVVLEFGQPLIIHPHQFVLARTLELLRVPAHLMAYVIGRSSWGRRGLIVATAVVVHPGFAGPVTLELRNLGEVPIALYPLDRIAQLTFHEVGAQGPPSSALSQFASSFQPGLGVVRDEVTADRIKSMILRRKPTAPAVAASESAPPPRAKRRPIKRRRRP